MIFTKTPRDTGVLMMPRNLDGDVFYGIKDSVILPMQLLGDRGHILRLVILTKES